LTGSRPRLRLLVEHARRTGILTKAPTDGLGSPTRICGIASRTRPARICRVGSRARDERCVAIKGTAIE
jgi:hypothetical protein